MTQAGEPLLVVAVSYNSAQVLPGWIASVRAALASWPAGRALVVDNASTDDSRGILTAAGVPVHDAGGNLGYAAAINLAYGFADPGEAILVLNPDTRLRSDSVTALMAELADPAVGLVVPRVLNVPGDGPATTAPSLRRFPTPLRAWGEAVLGGTRAGRRPRLGEVVPVGAQYEQAHDVEWATGAAVLISASARARLGEWDPTFFLYSEETEYFGRAARAGIRARYTPAAVVEHIGGQMETSERLWPLAVANRITLQRRGRGLGAALAAQGGVIANEAVRSVGRSPAAAVHRAGLRAALRPGAVARPGPQGLVAFAGVDWWYHNRAHSDVQLLRQVAQSRPVLMVNSIGLRVPLPGRSTQPLRRVLRKARSVARFVATPDPAQPNFHVMTPLALPVYGNPRVRELSARFTRWQVSKAARWFALAEPNLFVTIPSADQVVAGMRRRSLTFNRSDLQSAFPEADGPRIEAMENALLRASDLIVYVSHELLAHDRALAGERGHFLDHGADLQHFSRRSELPADLLAIPGPRVGFFGGIDDYVIDFPLLAGLADALPEVSIVLIGDATCDMDELTAKPNIHWLGMRPYEQIPAYGSGFDVAFMPWLRNDWIRFCNPIKLKEYLALGLPVVSTDFPELAFYRDFVRVGNTVEEFAAQIWAALAEPADPALRAARRARVGQDTWAAKAAELLGLIDRIGLPTRPLAASRQA